jgi:hypothetical protein
MNTFKDIEVNKHKLKIIFDTEKEHWYILFPKYGQYVSGSFNDSRMERVHHPITIGTRQYELVLDPDDSLTNWESFSIFDCKKQCYIETAQGSI